MTSGIAGCTRDSRSSQRFSNIGGEARSSSVREGPREEASMPPSLTARLRTVLGVAQVAVLGRRDVVEIRAVARSDGLGLADVLQLGVLLLVAHRWIAFAARNSSSAKWP